MNLLDYNNEPIEAICANGDKRRGIVINGVFYQLDLGFPNNADNENYHIKLTPINENLISEARIVKSDIEKRIINAILEGKNKSVIILPIKID